MAASDSSEGSFPLNTPLMPSELFKICSFGWRPQLLTGFFINYLQQHFASQDWIEAHELRDLIWRPGEDTSILIESIYRWDPRKTGKRPGVVVKRNAMNQQAYGIGCYVGQDQQGNENFTTFWVGSHTLFCLAGEAAEAEWLAIEVQREILQMSPVLAQELSLMKLDVVQVGECSEIEESSENYVVPVVVTWAYEERWQLVMQALALRRVTLTSLLCC